MRDIEIKYLRFGHEEGAPPDVVNVRQVGRDRSIDSLAASIDAHGLIQPLTVKPGENGMVFVVDGNRRLAALRRLVEIDIMRETDAIPVVIAPDEASAREIGLAANTQREALHEADQYEACRQLRDDGLDEDAIARRFGLKPKTVRRILALGSLSPKILAAWRSGELGDRADEVVRVFTIAPSIKDQERVFEKYRRSGFWPHSIRQAFGADRGEAQKHIRLVGIEAYRAAGGRMVEDLFGDDHAVLDPALAKKLADERLQAECDRLVAAGWSWAKPASDLPDGARYSWSTVLEPPTKAAKGEAKRLKELEAVVNASRHTDRDAFDAAEAEHEEISRAQRERGYDDAAKAKAGCIVSMGYHGELEIRFGVIQPKAAKAEKTKPAKGKAGKEEAPQASLSNALTHRLSVQMTLGLQEAVKSHPHVALAMLLAGASCSTVYNSPVRVRMDGFGASTYRPDGESFDALFGRFVDMTLEQLAEVAAQVAAASITFEAQHASAAIATHPGAIAITTALDPEVTAHALTVAFDAADYFSSASKPFVLTAIREAVNEDEARRAGKLKKAELVQFAIDNVGGTGWLPPEIRPATYSGPGVAVAAPMAQAAE